MSKIGKKIINIPEGVEVKIIDTALIVKGKLGTTTLPILKYITVNINDNVLSCEAKETHKQARSNWGTMRALMANAVKGVNEGYAEILEFEGIGFKASMEGRTLLLTMGYTHPLKFIIPIGVTIVLEKNMIKISGFDKQVVGEAAATIRSLRKPEPYKGTGIHYKGEVVKRKTGKKVAGASATA